LTTGDSRRGDHAALSLREVADRLAIRRHGQPRPRSHPASSGRDALAPVFDEVDDDNASGVTYCLAHHVKVDGSTRTLMLASIRYLDTFVKRGGVWLFAQRNLMVDWTDTRPLVTG
jgi:SnoaL-like domain